MEEIAGLKRLVHIQRAADYLGLSVHTVYTMVSQRRIPYAKVGRLVKFDLVLLDAWINKYTIMPMTPKKNRLKLCTERVNIVLDTLVYIPLPSHDADAAKGMA